MGVVGELSRLNQDGGIGLTGRIESPCGDAQRVFAPTRTPALDGGHLVEEHRPSTELRHPLTQHLTVHRVGQRQLLSAAVGRHRHQPGFLDGLQNLRADDVVECRGSERCAQGEQLERPSTVLPDPGDSCGDQVDQSRCVAQRPDEPPHTTFVDQRPRLLGAQHQLAEQQHVAAARRPQGVCRRAVDRRAERVVQQRLDAVAWKLVEVDA